MGDDVLQFYCEEDDCLYFYDTQKKRYRKICDIGCYGKLPLDIKQQILEAKIAAEETLNMPTE